jgi:uncharacterized iron-regulated membrane protein
LRLGPECPPLRPGRGSATVIALQPNRDPRTIITTAWQRWLEHPERSRLRNKIFQVHMMLGAMVSAYVFLMSLSGSVIVHRDQLSEMFSVDWLVHLHTNLASGPTGRLLNGIGAIVVTMICFTGAVIWWPGIGSWRRSMSVKWRAPFARMVWVLHSALGFWSMLLLLVWGITGIYFAFPRAFDVLFILDPSDRFTDQVLFWLTEVHFGRFGWLTRALWSFLGLIPTVLAFTGVFICCRRLIFKKPSNPNTQSG